MDFMRIASGTMKKHDRAPGSFAAPDQVTVAFPPKEVKKVNEREQKKRNRTPSPKPQKKSNAEPIILSDDPRSPLAMGHEARPSLINVEPISVCEPARPGEPSQKKKKKTDDQPPSSQTSRPQGEKRNEKKSSLVFGDSSHSLENLLTGITDDDVQRFMSGDTRQSVELISRSVARTSYQTVALFRAMENQLGDRKKLQDSVKKYKDDCKKKDDQVSSLTAQYNKKQAELEESEKRNLVLAEEVARLNKEKEELVKLSESKLDIACTQVAAAQNEVVQLRGNNNELQVTVTHLKGEADSLRNWIPEVKQEAVLEYMGSETFMDMLADYWFLCYNKAIKDANARLPDRPLDPNSFNPMEAFTQAMAENEEKDAAESSRAAQEQADAMIDNNPSDDPPPPAHPDS